MPFFLRYSTANAICVLTSAPYPVSCGCEYGMSGTSRFLLAPRGVPPSESCERAGEPGVRVDGLGVPPDVEAALCVEGFDILPAADVRVDWKLEAILSRYEGILEDVDCVRGSWRVRLVL